MSAEPFVRSRSGPFESWLSIGGLVFHVISDDRQLAWSHAGPLQAFVISPRCADVVVRAGWSESLGEPNGVTLFESGGAWRAVQDGAELVFSCRSSLGVPEPYITARFDPGFQRGDVRVNRRHFSSDSLEPISPLGYPLDELLTVHLLARGRGIEVHGSGVLDRTGGVYVFAGQSGAGKSTIARFWAHEPGITILSDERVVLRTDREQLDVYGTPWHGDAAGVSSRVGRLEGLFFLHHADTHRAMPLRRSQAVAQLLSCAFFPVYDRDAVAQTIAAADRVAGAAPRFELWFAPDGSIVDFVRALLASGPVHENSSSSPRLPPPSRRRNTR